jgi:hypothetical protein
MTIPKNKDEYDKLKSSERPHGKYMLESVGAKVNYLYDKIEIVYKQKTYRLSKKEDNNDLLVDIYYNLIKHEE